MGQTLVERAWAWLHATFPERQIYIRSDGRVQFFTCSATLQATCAGLSLIFLGWVAFASVNVIFKDRIIAAKDHRYQQMQGTYENRIADQQLAYDQLNNALISAEDHFKATADELAAKQKSVATLLGDRKAFDAAFAATKDENPAAGMSSGMGVDDAIAEAPARGGAASDSLGSDSALPAAGAGYAIIPPRGARSSGSGGSELTIMPEPVDPQPRTAHPTRASMLDVFTRLADLIFPSDAGGPRASATRLANPTGLAAIEQQTARVAQMDRSETSLLKSLDMKMSQRAGGLRRELAGLGVGRLPQASGGPLTTVESVRVDGVSDAEFASAYTDALVRSSELQSLVTALRHVPLSTPVHGAQFELTSGFGMRVDPFTGRTAFHPGCDFAGPWGSIVGATAPGVVVWAGYRGGYGNMVEVDHGYGFHTRYGHLASVLVRAGARVEKGSPLGRLGSTGRSTGPHVHYEVWVANAVKDPSRFIAAGRTIAQ
jgi:murein DD-endopeptidase MepM/ murein hydrolase activator NlpD